MKPVDPRAERMREALDLVLANLEDELGRLRARVTTLVASLAAEAQVLSERCKCDGADAVETAMAENRANSRSEPRCSTPRKFIPQPRRSPRDNKAQ